MLMVLLPLFALLLLLPALPKRTTWTTSVITLLFLSVMYLLFYMPLTGMSLGAGLYFNDLLSFNLVLITLWLAGLMIMASQKTLLTSNNPVNFIGCVLILTLTLVVAFSTSSFILFYIFFEGSLIPTLLLVLGWGYQPERLQASMYLILYTVAASLPLLISIIFMFKSSGHLSMILSMWTFYSSSTMAKVWWVITIAAFLVKTPLFLTHLWLPKAHVEAPVAGSMVLAGVLLKLGSYGLLRIAAKHIMLNNSTTPLIMSVALIGGAITSFICVRQTDVKALIAYSSVSHMGLATAGIMSNTQWGWQGAFMMLIAHGLCSSCMFSLANMTYETVSSRGMYITKGMMTFFPSLTFWWFCFSACNMAAPPSMNLGGEILLISSSISTSAFNIFPLSIMAFMAAAYSLYLYTSTQHGAPSVFHNPLTLFTPRNYTICLAHLTPLILIILKMDLVTAWV
uniref:NADH-ubiquinone oxidoreductase chain 4 n=1 Tax=Prionospio sp. 5 MH-2023 TaxID=3059273 RepID=A0AAU6QH14_9ANNE